MEFLLRVGLGEDRLGEDRLGEDCFEEDCLGEDRLGEDRLGEDCFGEDCFGDLVDPAFFLHDCVNNLNFSPEYSLQFKFLSG